MRMIGVLDYGIGNIGSILNMLKKVGAKAQPVTTGEALSACDRLILPGVGAFDQGMALLNQSGMRGALDEAVASGKPVLGICLGMQMLGLCSEEGVSDGLGYIPFSMRRFRLDDCPAGCGAGSGIRAARPFLFCPQLLCGLRGRVRRSDGMRLRRSFCRSRPSWQRLGRSIPPGEKPPFRSPTLNCLPTRGSAP